jgi:hypothetical protein
VANSAASVSGSPIQVPAHDPIAIAALIAELPELEAKFLAAMKTAEEANKALDVIQDRLDQAMKVLRSKAPRGSKWNSRKAEMSATEVNSHLQKMVVEMQKVAGMPPPMLPPQQYKPNIWGEQ